MPRVLLAGLWHETNTFSPVKADLAAFRAYQYAEGDEIFARYGGTNTEMGGMTEAGRALGFDLVPAVFAGAIPSGTVTREAIDTLVGRICETARQALETGPLDGALIGLHGAMVAEGIERADAYVLERLREVVGPGLPIVATYDLHANLNAELVQLADVLIGYDTFPHVDMGDRGREAAQVLSRILESGTRPAKCLVKLPLLTVSQMQATHDHPMREVMPLVEEAERDPGIWTCSIGQGFPWSDIASLGVGVVAYGEAAAARRWANRIAQAIWDRREDFVPDLIPPEEAVRLAVARNRGPIVLAEPSDNVGGGTPGDGVVLLKALLEGGARKAVMVIWDPEAVRQARAAGLGGRFSGLVGGHASELHGPPTRLDGEVVFLETVTYRRDGRYMTGQRVPMGDVAVIRAGGVQVVLTSERCMPFDDTHLRACGVQPREQHILVAKSGAGWKGAFGDYAEHAYFVDTPGTGASNLDRVPLTRLQGPFFPLQRDVTWNPDAETEM